jgi:hypothetical protein
LESTSKISDREDGANAPDQGFAETGSAMMQTPNPLNSPSTQNGDVPPAKVPPVLAGVKQDIFTADTGEVVVRWPAVISEADFEDIEGWLDMLKRKIKRSVKSDGGN